ncbi:MAG: hypothetical protein BWX98_02607 [Candidatus Aminicenantes bacterium ADurb.Bin147]|nr:MAG: hypothetical protein BWX98_02607 [Candidatus Aminicenantes bacterium ADurb.Bin147]
MGRRRGARETALQILYELEFNESGPEEVLRRRKAEKPAGAGAGEYAAWLVRGVFGRRSELDDRIQGAARNWRVARMGLVDRNILRLAVYEMLEEKTLVPAIIINEAVEIARRFGGGESAGEAGANHTSEKNEHDRSPKPQTPPRPAGTPRGGGRRTPSGR